LPISRTLTRPANIAFYGQDRMSWQQHNEKGTGRQVTTTEQRDQSLDPKSRLWAWAQAAGLFRLGRALQRNRGQLLILCYHGISKSDEHRWYPTLYMPRHLFRQRLQTLQKFGYQVLPLATALDLLVTGSLT
jgi:hypothetical protein